MSIRIEARDGEGILLPLGAGDKCLDRRNRARVGLGLNRNRIGLSVSFGPEGNRFLFREIGWILRRGAGMKENSRPGKLRVRENLSCNFQSAFGAARAAFYRVHYRR